MSFVEAFVYNVNEYILVLQRKLMHFKKKKRGKKEITDSRVII